MAPSHPKVRDADRSNAVDAVYPQASEEGDPKPTDQVEAILRSLPDVPGCYLMKSDKGAILYVGKAKSLKNRVRSYFRNVRGLTPKTRALVRKIRDIETIVTADEVEALVLENNLIKRHRPAYNIMLRDDKSYPYIRLSVQEPFPRLTVVRKVKRDGARYYGPYVGAGAMRATLRVIQTHFPLADCDIVIDGGSERPCLQYQIGRCKAPCTGYQNQADYKDTVTQVRQFLEGRDRELVATLTGRMEAASNELEFERAAGLRDQVRHIEQTLTRQRITTPGGGEVDVYALARVGDWISLQVLFVRDGSLVGNKGFVWEDASGLADPEVMRSFVQQFYADGVPLPKSLLLPEPLPDGEAMAAYLTVLRGRVCKIETPSRGRGMDLLKLAASNAQKSLDQRLQAEQAGERGVLALQKLLDLKHPPNRIEGFDISHIQGDLTVASMVVREGGGPKKSDYRHFRIRSTKGPDDFLAMREVVTRHYKKLSDEGQKMPDLVLIDGGKGQLSMALRAFSDLGIHGDARPPIIGLAKERGEKFERIFVPGRKNPIVLKPAAPATRIVQMVRDEAHRFAVSYHRKLRSLKIRDSELDAIPGIGKARKTALLTTFGSVEGIKKASLEALSACPRMTGASAEAVWAALHPAPADSETDATPPGKPVGGGLILTRQKTNQ